MGASKAERKRTNVGEAKRRAARSSTAAETGTAAEGSARTLAARAGAELAAGRFDAAVASAREAVARAPGDAAVHHLLGVAQLRAGARESALQSLERASALDGSDPRIRFDLALARRALGDEAGAAQALGELAARLPRDVNVRHELALTLEKLGRDAEAEAAFREALKLAPANVAAHCGLARVLYARGALDEARSAQRWATTLDPRAIEDGAIGSASPSDAGATASHAAAAALDACRGFVAEGESIEALVAARELKVIDDFEPDFEGWRRFALARRYADPHGASDVNFPGLQTPTAHATPQQMQRIADAIGRGIKWRLPTHGVFRLSFHASQARSDIHVDEEVCRPMYAGVLYLSRPQDCRGGTSFWRHVDTGWEAVPPDEVAARSRWGSFRAFQRAEVVGDGTLSDFATLTRRREAWRKLFEVPMRANRLILYRSDFFHAISSVFGATPEDARLVQLFFFEPHPAESAARSGAA
jgi:Flp pilus assembly protein TadD